jgi:hypothetical protein
MGSGAADAIPLPEINAKVSPPAAASLVIIVISHPFQFPHSARPAAAGKVSSPILRRPLMFGRVEQEHASATVPAAKSGAFLVSLRVNAGQVIGNE